MRVRLPLASICCNMGEDGLARRFLKEIMIIFLYLFGYVFRSKGIPVLVYHSIDDSGSLLSVAPDIFLAQMQYLRDHGYRSMTLGALCRLLREGRPLPSKTVVISFDDGFRNNYEVAFPVLMKLGFTATLFPVTGCISGSMNWDKTPDVPNLQLLRWEEIREMADKGLEIGAHSLTHRNLCKVSGGAARSEIVDSRSEIESKILRQVGVFAFPYGVSSDAVEEIVREAGFLGAVTMGFGKVKGGDDPLRLKRLNVTGISHVGPMAKMLFFKCCLFGTAGWYMALKDYLPSLVACSGLPDGYGDRGTGGRSAGKATDGKWCTNGKVADGSAGACRLEEG